tara:strand:- start:141 stop:1346 length:1206 start_codon:yes stop_codon:yes gene_type:complete
MKKLNKILLSVLVLCATGPMAFAGVQDAATNYEVPTYDSMQLDVHGQDLFSYDDSGALKIHVGSDFVMDNQSPMMNFGITNKLKIDAGMANADADFSFNLMETAKVSYQQFFGDSRGLSVRGDVALGLGVGDATQFAAVVHAGAAYGRMVNAKTVAQAAAIFELLEREATDEDLLKVAEIIGQRDSYNTNYRENGPVEFFKALGEALGTTDTFTLKNVLDSPIYRIGNRNAGWDVGVDVEFATGDHGGAGGEALSLHQSFNLGILLSDTMGLWVKETFAMGLMGGYTGGAVVDASTIGEMSMAVGAEVGFSLDHTIQWHSEAVANIGMDIPDGGDLSLNYQLMLTSDYAVGTDMMIGGYFDFCGGDGENGFTKHADANAKRCVGDGEVHYGVGLNFKYIIL